jgi:AmiR/NasT family two-component response regulator
MENETTNITIHNVETGEITTRPMTEDELAREEIAAKNYQVYLNEQKAKATAKAALLERLGITEDEARLLLG